MVFNKTQCCAISEISGLSCHSSAKEAMKDFCKQSFTKPVKFGSGTAAQGTIYSFYLFTAAIYKKSHYWHHEYGNNFAKLIRQEKLGEVWESPVIRNDAFHDDHYNQVWIWMPSIVALKAWWAKVNAPTEPKEVKEIKQCPSCGEDIDVDGLCAGGCDEEFEPEDDDWDDSYNDDVDDNREDEMEQDLQEIN